MLAGGLCEDRSRESDFLEFAKTPALFLILVLYFEKLEKKILIVPCQNSKKFCLNMTNSNLFVFKESNF